MVLPPFALVLIALVLAAWTLGAAWAVLAARGRLARAEATQRLARRLSRMIEEAPALPLLVRADGRIEGPARLAGWFGLDAMPGFLSEIDAGEKGLDEVQLSQLSDAVRRAQKTGAPFELALTPRGGKRSLGARGHLADPQVSPGGAALVWFFDFTDSANELRKLRAEAASARADFVALAGLIEAAPLPMWFRGPDMALRLVNSAYVKAVGATSAADVVATGTELIEPVEGVSAAKIAQQVYSRRLPMERVVSATIGGQRRSIRVSDLPLGEDGVAGYAVDTEEMEELQRQFRRFREAQREMLGFA